MKRVLVFVALALTACDGYHPAENYCEAEKRKIPDIEMKARLLASIRSKTAKNRFANYGLPEEMEQHLLDRGISLEESAISDDVWSADEIDRMAVVKQKVTQAMMDFIEKNPLCCQLAVKEIWNKSRNPGSDDELPSLGWFANFYIQRAPYVRIPDGGPKEAYEARLPTPRDYGQYRAFNCGSAHPISGMHR